MHRRIALIGAIALTATLAACGSSSHTSSGASSGGSEIDLGALSSESGPAPLPIGADTTKAFFDLVNKNGGVNGHKIKYTVIDDGGSAAQTLSSAKQLVGEDKVLAMVGGSSLLDCLTADSYYRTTGIVDVSTLAVTPACFSEPEMAPVNAGSVSGTQVDLQYMTKVLNKLPTCVLLFNYGAVPLSEYTDGVSAWEKESGETVKDIVTVNGTADPTPAIVALKNAGCKSIQTGASAQNLAPLLQAASAQGMGTNNVTWSVLSNLYSASVPKACGAPCNGVYANAEFEPYTGTSSALADYNTFLQETGIAASAESEGAFIADNVVLKALKSITGPYTRESVTAAIKATTYDTPLLAQPWTFESHPNTSSKMVQIENGKWTGALSDWITISPTS